MFIVVLLCGCNANNQPPQDNGKTSDIEFHPPLDGKLTEQQIMNYIQIKIWLNRQRDMPDAKSVNIPADSVAGAKQIDQPRYYDELEKDAAKSVNMNVNEYYWVKDTIINTQSIILLQRYYQLNQKIMRLLNETLSHYKKQQTQQQKTAEKQTMNRYVDEMKQELTNLDGKVAELGSLSEAERYNIELVSRYQSQLASVDNTAASKPVQ